jgi:hypothetical protein
MNDGGLCGEFPGIGDWLNLCTYSVFDMAIITTGTLFWCIAYYNIIRNSFKNQFSEMPMMVAAANIAWEFVWSFSKFNTDMGHFFLWGFRLWFFMDVLIFYNVYRYGHKQMTLDFFKEHFKPLFVGITLVWVVALYLFAEAGLDTSIAATSAYIITALMSSLYITLFLSQKNPGRFSFTTAWTKGVGSAFMSIYVFTHYNDFYFLQLLALVVLVLDISYVYLFIKERNKTLTT